MKFTAKLLFILVGAVALAETKDHIRIPRAKPGAKTTAKPGAPGAAATTVAPGGTTAAPGAGGAAPNATAPGKPGAATTAKPGAKPGGKPPKAGAKPPAVVTDGLGPAVGGGSPIIPPGVVVPPDVPTHILIGFAGGKYLWLANDKTSKDDAGKGCESIKQYYIENNMPEHAEMDVYLAVGEDDGERSAIAKFMKLAGETQAWLGSVTQTGSDGKATVIQRTAQGIILMDEKARKKRETKLQSILTDTPMNARKKRQDDAGKGPISITVQDTHYPWLADWATSGGCRDIRGCDPIECNVTTPPCDFMDPGCQVSNQTNCGQINSGNCTVVCEKCTITAAAECWMADGKCEIVKERSCSMSTPDCNVTTPACEITRPPCVTKQAECAVANNTNPGNGTDNSNSTDCQVAPPCGTPQGIVCVTSERPCSQEEVDAGKTACHIRNCTANPVCIKPEYCRPGGNGVITVDCPPPITFCPPETVHCPPPEVECGQPELVCTEPEMYCPPPQVVCTQPQVSCSSPTVSCPNVVAQCDHPDVQCSKPAVDCDPPVLECSEPKPCLVKPPVQIPLCPVDCTGDDCKCQMFTTDGTSFVIDTVKCDAQYRGLCVGQKWAPVVG